MKTIMKLEDLTTIDQLVDFLSGTALASISVSHLYNPEKVLPLHTTKASL